MVVAATLAVAGCAIDSNADASAAVVVVVVVVVVTPSSSGRRELLPTVKKLWQRKFHRDLEAFLAEKSGVPVHDIVSNDAVMNCA